MFIVSMVRIRAGLVGLGLELGLVLVLGLMFTADMKYKFMSCRVCVCDIRDRYLQPLHSSCQERRRLQGRRQ